MFTSTFYKLCAFSLVVWWHAPLVYSAKAVSRKLTPEENLHNYLFGDPHRDLTVFPSQDATLDLTFQIKLFGADIETESETLSIDVNFIQEWRNARLAWKPQDFDNITEINISPELTWVPDLYIQSNIEEDKEYNGMLSTMLTNVVLRQDGTHRWLAPTTLVLRCPIYVKNYPFDTQRCHLQFGSFAFNSHKLNINVKEMDLDLYEDGPEWELLSANHGKEYVIYPGSKITYTDALYVLTMRRKALAPMKHLIFPNLTLIALTMLVFVIPIDASERIGYLFTTFLAIAFFMTDTIGMLPLSSMDVPICMVFMGISTLSLSLLALCLCYSIVCYYANANVVTLPHDFRKFSYGAAKYLRINTEREISDWRKLLGEVRNVEHFIDENEAPSTPSPKVTKETYDDYAEIADRTELFEEIFSDKDDLREFHVKLDSLLTTFEEEDDTKWRQTEWSLFSKVLDQICFLVFLSYFILSLILASIRVFLIY